MGGLIFGGDGGEIVDWITDLEQQRRPPSTLVNICANYVAKHLEETVLVYDFATCFTTEGNLLQFQLPEEFQQIPHPKISLPVEVSQRVWDFCDYEEKDEKFGPLVAAFGSGSKGGRPNPLPLACLDFSTPNRLTSPLLLEYLTAQGSTLLSLNLSGCSHICPDALLAINKHCPRLVNLVVGRAHQILTPQYEHDLGHGNIITGPKALETLVIHGFPRDVVDDPEYFLQLTSPLENTLTNLDLSGCEVDDFKFLGELRKLRRLLLYNVNLLEDSPVGFFTVLPRLSKAIRHLDLSQPPSRHNSWGKYQHPNELLDRVVRSVPQLLVLEISGTNLAGDGVAQLLSRPPGMNWPAIPVPEQCCDIPGLNSRSLRPLEYLGLYGSAHDASHRHCIPAKVVGGDKDELQIINAARTFIDRGEVMERILNDLFHLFRTEEGKHVQPSLRLILCAMERHPTEKHIQISGSASLFYIVKNNQNVAPVQALKRRILDAIVSAMELHVTDSTMMRNGCLTICHFKIPHDVMFVYEKLVCILLETLGALTPPPTNEDFNERIAIYLLNSLACQVEGEHKRLVGDLGAIQKMLTLIQGRLARGECDDVMEIAWSTMWNVTDETPENCAKFLAHNGMSLFLQCLHAFPNQPELLRNMMGLLGNVAEVKELRGRLMTEAFIQVFYQLLNSKQDNIEVSYNAAGVLAHILSDGEEAWVGVGVPSCQQVCDRMSQNIREWAIHSPRNINYRSFKPILRLLLVHHTLQCRLWAAWALANLTTVYPEKYVKLLDDEKGLAYLETQFTDTDSPELVHYSRMAYDNVRRLRLPQQPPPIVLQLVG